MRRKHLFTLLLLFLTRTFFFNLNELAQFKI